MSNTDLNSSVNVEAQSQPTVDSTSTASERDDNLESTHIAEFRGDYGGYDLGSLGSQFSSPFSFSTYNAAEPSYSNLSGVPHQGELSGQLEDSDSDEELVTVFQDRYGVSADYKDVGSETNDTVTTAEDANNSSRNSITDNREEFNLDKERLFRPIVYAQRLNKIVQTVCRGSFFHIINKPLGASMQSSGDLQIPFPLPSVDTHFKPGDLHTTPLVQKLYSRVVSSLKAQHPTAEMFPIGPGTDSSTVLHFIGSRNILHNVVQIIYFLQSSRYCSEIISILVADNNRSNVARLLPISCSKIFDLAESFESCVEVMLSKSTLEDSMQAILESDVLPSCRAILDSLGLFDEIGRVSRILLATVHLLDTAVLSYATAHLATPGNQGLGKGHENINISTDFESMIFSSSTSQTTVDPFHSLPRSSIVFELRSFLCLDEFFGQAKAWVCNFKPVSASQQMRPARQLLPMYLSTTADTFADVWGPMWSRCDTFNPSNIIHYCVGNGVIVPWKQSEPLKATHSTTQSMEIDFDLNPGEVLCHWIPDHDYDNGIKTQGQSDYVLSHKDHLLIGARVKLDNNINCPRIPGRIIEKFKNKGNSKIAGTINKTRVRDTETILFQVGGSGILGGLQLNYKIRERNWKQVIVERWRNEPIQRDPLILQYRLGIEVSICTQNARRQRLITLLGSPNMLGYLGSLSLQWTYPDCKDAFFVALASPDHTAFQQLWNSNVDWQMDMGNAISCCLEVLAQTGYSDQGLEAFWVPKKGPHLLITLKRETHSWAGFLKDSSHSCSMVVFSDICLEAGKNWAKACESLNTPTPHISQGSTQSNTIQGECILETSFVVNPDQRPKSLTCHHYRRSDGTPGSYRKRWNALDCEVGDKFSFGENGKIRVLSQISGTQFLGTWKSLMAFENLNNKSSSAQSHHHELISDVDEELEIRPIDVILFNHPQEIAASLSRRLTRIFEEKERPTDSQTCKSGVDHDTRGNRGESQSTSHRNRQGFQQGESSSTITPISLSEISAQDQDSSSTRRFQESSSSIQAVGSRTKRRRK